MRTTKLKAGALLMLALLGAAVRAQEAGDPPTRVGRISSAVGQVTLASANDDAANQSTRAQLNWPVTSGSRILTDNGASAEFRVGAAAVRLASNSELEVLELDDHTFRLLLHYGTAAVRIHNAEVAADFEMNTPQGRVLLLQPGWLRVEAVRNTDISRISVLAGKAQVDRGGDSLTLDAGRRAELGLAELSTGPLQHDSIDNWPGPVTAASTSLRYLSDDTTGYEELDRHGSWREDSEYGPLWQPSALPAGWAPYRDGSWTWVQPWGWTWVDNAPWGYAPSHYGRWVLVGQRWCWSPGLGRARGVWAPALVGWVGGHNWQARFGSRGVAPAVGWYPLSPYDRYVPGYRASADYQRRFDYDHDGRWTRRGERDGRGYERRDGLTIVPNDHFSVRRTVAVGAAARAIVAAREAVNVPQGSAPPPSPGIDMRGPDGYRMRGGNTERNVGQALARGGTAPAPVVQQQVMPSAPALTGGSGSGRTVISTEQPQGAQEYGRLGYRAAERQERERERERQYPRESSREQGGERFRQRAGMGEAMRPAPHVSMQRPPPQAPVVGIPAAPAVVAQPAPLLSPAPAQPAGRAMREAVRERFEQNRSR